MRLVWIRWLDATYLGNGWKQAEKLETEAGFMVESAGLLVKETKKGIFIATDYDPDDPSFRHVSFIPRAMIKKKRVFKVSE